MFRILSIDGGGIRGIVPALVLAELERRSGRPTHQLFDLIAGTSTGGILALGLTRAGEGRSPRYSSGDLVDFYEEDGHRIFSRSVWHQIRSVAGIIEELYPSKGIEEVLKEKFGRSELLGALTPVMVTAYDIEVRQPYFFKSHRCREEPLRNFFMRDAARATSAAPTYFEPACVTPLGGDEALALVDGGMFANNPAACALVEAIADFGADPSEIVMLSLGTGELTRPILFEKARDWGLAMWARPLLSVVFDGVSDTVDYQLKSILGDGPHGPRYTRIQAELHEGNDDMDDAGRTNIKVLKLLARDLIHRHSDDLDRWADRLAP